MKNASRILALLLALLTVCSALAMTGCNNTAANGTETDTQAEEKETNAPEKEATEEKTSDFVGLDWVNAVDAGFVGDGETANDDAFAIYAKRNNGKPLYFPKGVYCFEETLNFPDRMYIKMDPEAELKCIATKPIDYFITLRGQYAEQSDAWVDLMEYAHESYIDGGIINCNYRAKCALGLFQGMHTNFENFKITNVLEKGIQTLISKTTDGTYNFKNVFIYNTESIKGTIGVYDNGYDNHFDGVSVCNFETAFYTVGGRFTECSAWNLDMACAETCTFAYIEGNQSVWYNPSVDTYRYGFRFAQNASTSIFDMVWITNAVFYTESLQQKYPRTLFFCEGTGIDSRIMLVGLQIPNNEANFDFSNKELPNAVFLNVRSSYTDGTRTVKNFRNDTQRLLGLADSIVPEKTGNLTAGSDFDALTENATYNCELRVGKDGKNVPPVKEVGTLTVKNTGKLITQEFIGTSTTLQRIHDGTKWSAWRTVG